jgi:hypothetical protein
MLANLIKKSKKGVAKKADGYTVDLNRFREG